MQGLGCEVRSPSERPWSRAVMIDARKYVKVVDEVL